MTARTVAWHAEPVTGSGATGCGMRLASTCRRSLPANRRAVDMGGKALACGYAALPGRCAFLTRFGTPQEAQP